MQKLSVVTIAKNEEKFLPQFFEKIAWVDEIILVDNNSSDKTKAIAIQYTPNVYSNKSVNLGELKNYAISKATKDWILLLDVDEHVSNHLRDEIVKILNENGLFDAYRIQYENYFAHHRLIMKGQVYSKIRLFRKGKGTVKNDPVHEEVVTKGKIGLLEGKIMHYSFKSFSQIIKKFTFYSKIESAQLMLTENLSLKKLTLYPLHMFYALFIKDQGYKDGIWGFMLALLFAYYEFMRYFYLLMAKLKLSK